MPVIRIQRSELERLGVSVAELVENVRMLGADLKDAHGEEILVEFFPDRPDLYTVEGIARGIKNYLGKGTNKRYKAVRSEERVFVDSTVKNVRPYIVATVIRDININKGMIKSMMEFQEKLHITVGRKRKKIAIGIHDYDKISGPFTYTTKSEEFSFVPLGFNKKMSLKEILETHPKGVKYRHILEQFGRYPIILDSHGEVVSFPPIINGTLTQVTTHTKNLFIDMTGTDLNALLDTLNIIACSFADRGGIVESVEINYGSEIMSTPRLNYEEIVVPKEKVDELIGFKLNNKEIIKALARMGYDSSIDEDNIKVLVPPYRIDILHYIDIIEDIAKGYGYDNIPSKKIEKYHRGRGFNENIPRKIMIGLGFLEIKTLTLVSMAQEYKKMGIEPKENVVVANPVSEGTETLRTWLIPSLIAILQKNKHRDLPQKIFELGYVRTYELETHLAFLYEDSKVGFTNAKSIVERILEDFKIKNYEFSEKSHGSFIPGRCANIIINGKELGFFGEITPAVLENFEIGYPTIAGELKLNKEIIKE